MAVHCASVGDGLTRDAGTYISFASAWSMAMWTWVDAIPSVGQEILLWRYGDITGTNDYIQLGVVNNGSGSGLLRLTVKSVGVTSTVDSAATYRAGRWMWVGVRRSTAGTGFTQRLDFSEATLVKAAPTLTETDEYLGTDGSGPAGARFAYVRVWQATLAVHGSAFNERSSYEAYQSSPLADTPLPDATDLLDLTANNRDWSAVGSLADSQGPLDYTDNAHAGSVFKDDLNDQVEGSEFFYKWNWNSTTGLGTRRVGCGRSRALACAANGTLYRGFPASVEDLALRFQAAVRSGLGAGEWLIGGVIAPPTSGTGFQVSVRIQGDGSLRIRLTLSFGVTSNYDSAAGLIPQDGTWHGYQILAHCDDTSQRVRCYLDNVLILDTGSVSATGLDGGFRRASRILFTLYSDANVGAIDNVQAEPNAAVVDWPACLATPYTTCSPVIAPITREQLGPLSWTERYVRVPST